MPVQTNMKAVWLFQNAFENAKSLVYKGFMKNNLMMPKHQFCMLQRCFDNLILTKTGVKSIHFERKSSKIGHR